MSPRRLACVLSAAVFLVLVPIGSASAHVTANVVDARQGGFTVITFRMPNERDDASSVKLDVQFPPDQPLASVSVKPVAGWTANITRSETEPFEAFGEELTEAVSQITWTATEDTAVKPGEFQEFPVSVGPLPEADTMVFKAIQTYSSGEIVRWIEEPTEAAPEPEYPAPQIQLLPADAADDDATQVAAQTEAQPDDGNDAMPVAIAALVVAVLGLLTAIGAILAARRATSGPSTSVAAG